MKKNKKYLIFKLKQKGQMTIFFAVTLMILISIMAFIVNVGIFVKAKINLQNAVDAAAWSGAAAESRQLTKIAYLNWEMRNAYKEWMFKYWILGTLSNTAIETNSNDILDLRLETKDWQMGGQQAYDIWNLPSTCIHFAEAEGNICKIFNIPGLPRFENPGIIQVDSIHAEVIGSISTEKAKDCARRTDLNFLTNLFWIFGTDPTVLSAVMGTVPNVAAHREGAFPKAMELAFRIRNLEKVVNTPPIDGGICLGGSCSTDVNSLNLEGGQLPLHERSIKAFWAGYRNLSAADELKNSFVLHEIPPNPKSSGGAGSGNLSYMFIPGGNQGYTEKYYLDLRIYLVNFATFFSAFVPLTDDTASTDLEAACGVSRVAIPIPSYPFGFEKNDSVLTYYAVRGEAEFIGLFNPFQEAAKLKAYAAAKPYGGRIGPKLFRIEGDDENKLVARTQSGAYRSFHYAMGLNTFEAPPAGEFDKSLPIPMDLNFWATSGNPGQNIGGKDPSDSKFVIPNMIYTNSGDLGSGVSQLMAIPDLGPPTTLQPLGDLSEYGGLFQMEQFEALKALLGPVAGAIDTAAIDAALKRVQAPTDYEANNYLVPAIHNDGFDSIGQIQSLSVEAAPGGDLNIGSYRLFAPTYCDNCLYSGPVDLVDNLYQLIDSGTQARDTYLEALRDVAEAVRNTPVAEGTDPDAAADTIYDQGPDAPSQNSMAGRFRCFYSLGEGNCSGLTLHEAMETHWASKGSQWAQYFVSNEYVMNNLGLNVRTAYYPGDNHGADDNFSSDVNHPFLSGVSTNHRRNFYSTKFIPLNSVTSSGVYMDSAVGAASHYCEKTSGSSCESTVTTPAELVNYLDSEHSNVWN